MRVWRTGSAVVFRTVLVLTAFLAPGPGGSATAAPRSSARAMSEAFAEVATEVAPATVYILADRDEGLAAGLQQLARDYELPLRLPEGLPVRNSAGSGVIVRADGLVLTNHHVVNAATHLYVVLSDKRRFPAHVLGSDPRTDMAVVIIDGEGPFPTAPIGDSDRLRVGEWVMAVGHPFDFQFTVTVGVVSARGRRNIGRDEIQDYIQTDAAVNPGSSGGPLFSLSGELVGINTAIYTPSGGAAQNAGVSFAIPSNMAGRIADELAATGKVARAAIGVGTRDAAPSPADPRPGAEVTRLAPDGPAERAGLRRGDVIVAVNDEPIGGQRDLVGLVLAAGAGAELRIRYERGGHDTVTRCETVAETTLGRTVLPPASDAPRWAGLTYGVADEVQRAQFGVATADPGVLILAVEPGSPGALAGAAPGDLITKVSGEVVPTPAALQARVEGKGAAMVEIWRADGLLRLAVAGVR